MTEPSKDLERWLRHIENVHRRTVAMGLDRSREVLQRLNAIPLPYILVSVAGTNGKGSSVGLCEAVLAEAGHRVGAYTSPHLVHYPERIRVNRATATNAELCNAFEKIDLARGDIPLTYFEFSTLAALQIFAHQRLDVAVMEVGMGGRLDAVNAVDADVGLVTSIGVDHVDWLGHDREQIAVEKAGIFRRDRPAVVAEVDPPDSLIDSAERIGARLFRLGKEYSYETHRGGWDWWGPGDKVHRGLPIPALLGSWQLRNAAGVLMALDCLRARIPVEAHAIHRGLKSVQVPGRFQVVDGAPQVILDVAHNVDAVSAMRDQLRAAEARGRTYAVCAMLRDKPIRKIAAMLADDVDHWFVAPIHDPRGATGEDMHHRILQGLVSRSSRRVTECRSITIAFDKACAQADPEDRILVFGSFHTVGDIIAHLKLSSV